MPSSYAARTPVGKSLRQAQKPRGCTDGAARLDYRHSGLSNDYRETVGTLMARPGRPRRSLRPATLYEKGILLRVEHRLPGQQRVAAMPAKPPEGRKVKSEPAGAAPPGLKHDPIDSCKSPLGNSALPQDMDDMLPVERSPG